MGPYLAIISTEERHFDHAIHGPDVVVFLRHLQRYHPGPLMVIWDRLQDHRSGLTHHNSEAGSYGKFHIPSKPRLLPFSCATFR